jgi:hypothetical protein
LPHWEDFPHYGKAGRQEISEEPLRFSSVRFRRQGGGEQNIQKKEGEALKVVSPISEVRDIGRQEL